ncbi:MAG TPA: hypothetical protein VGO59_11815 [Verrucomicrobiae bacterium]
MFLCALLAWRPSAQGQDYLPLSVPASFTRDSNTTFLAENSNGPMRIATQGRWPARAWTLEMLVRVPRRPARDTFRLAHWENDALGCLFDFSLTEFGAAAKLYSWNRPGGFLAMPCAGGNGVTVQTSAPDRWVHVAVGCDFAHHLFMTSAREATGAILDSNMNFAPNPNTMTNTFPAWASIGELFAKGLPAELVFGSSPVEIKAVKISDCYRGNLFEVAPAMPAASVNNWLPAALDSARAFTRTVTRNVGYPIGYGNYKPMPVAETFLELAPGSPPITITLTNQPIGLYSFMVYGQIALGNRASLNQVWNPCPMDFTAGADHGEMLLKQAFHPRRMQGFHFHATAPGNVTATFSLPARAMETVCLQQITLVDTLEGLPDVAVKTSQNIFHAGPRNQDTKLTAKRIERDDLIWNSLPPLNTPLQVDSMNNSFEKPPVGASVDTWVTASMANMQSASWLQQNETFSPLDFVDATTHARFQQSEILAWPVQPLPGNDPDCGWGIFSKSGGGEYYAQRAELLGARYLLFAGALMNSRGSLYGLNLGDKYLTNGDPAIGHDAAMALVRLAYDWPALEMNLHDVRQCTQSPDLDYNKDWSDPQIRNGKMMARGFSGPQVNWLFDTYDEIFPYLKNNQVFADAAHRHIPWINTPGDVIRLLDRYLVFASVKQATNGSQEIDPSANVQLMAARVLGPSQATAHLFDLTGNEDEIFPLAGADQELYGSALSRSGVYYIGSFMCYAVESAENTIQQASLIQNAKANGIAVPMDLSDVAKYPKVRAAGDFLVDMWVAGGFPFMAGDSSGGTHSGRQAESVLKAAGSAMREAFDLDGDPRLAWECEHAAGISNAAMAAAAATVSDPILHAKSRVVPDYGAILEMEPGENSVSRKTSATLRLGIGRGHAHSDYLDLNLFGLGLPIAVNLACRDEDNYWTRPAASWSYLQNHALAHASDDPKYSGAQNGEPWLRAFAPPFVSASYADPSSSNGFRLDRDTIFMPVGDSGTYYAFDVQRLAGNSYHTWCFHGCESSNLVLNVPMQTLSSNEWTGRTLENTRSIGVSSDVLQATWTMTRQAQSIPYKFHGGGVLKTVACEPSVLGALYNPALPPVHVRATLLGRGGDAVMQGDAYSAAYQYCFPFLWVQTTNEPISVYPAIYEWYRGETPVVAGARLLQRDPLQVEITTTAGQVDTCEFTPSHCLAVSRDTGGVRWIKLSGSAPVNLPDVSLSPAANYLVTITDINYQRHTLATSGPLPSGPGVVAGNDGRRIFLQLSGSGTNFTWADDLLVQEGRIAGVSVTGPDSISISSDQPVLFDGAGNRDSAAMTVSTEDGLWNFRNGRVVKHPPGASLTPRVFTDANGDGRIDMKTYEIGVGDSLGVPADVAFRRNADGWIVNNNVPVRGSLHGSHAVTFDLPPSNGWQTVTNSNYVKASVL